MQIVQDINRPDVNGTPPKMLALRDVVAGALDGLAPVLQVSTDDNLGSSIHIRGSFTEKPTNGIFENGEFFRIFIWPTKGKRYYEEGDKVRLELSGVSYKMPNRKLRGYTGPIDKVIVRLVGWLKSNKQDIGCEPNG